MSAKALRDAAAILLAEADRMDGKSPGTFYGEHLPAILQMWNSMLAQFAAEDTKVADEREIGSVVTAYQTVISAAQRERWPTPEGTYWVGNYKTAKDLRASIRALMQTEQYKAWAAHPLNAHLVPKSEPTV